MQGNIAELLSKLEGVKNIASREEPLELELELLDATLSKLSSKTGKGSDVLGPANIKLLPSNGKEELLHLMMAIGRQLAWPWQLLLSIVALFKKPVPGDGPIHLLPRLVRLWSQLHDEPIRNWALIKLGPWDQAIAGSNAIQAAFHRIFLDETAARQSRCYASNCTDVVKFYEMVDLAKIAERGVELGYPARILYLSLIMYIAPRVLREALAFSPPVLPVRSIAAGCKSAIHFARIALYGIMEQAYYSNVSVQSKQWVDDLVLRTEGTRQQVKARLHRAGLELCKNLVNEGFKVAPKSVIIASTPLLAKALASDFTIAGFPMQWATQAPDLGIARNTRR